MPLTPKCTMSATERISQVIVPTSVTPGTLLFQMPVNPYSSPRLQATATQFDSWYGEMTLQVETTGNSFSSDYVVLRHVPNGDPGRLPTNASTLLSLAETADRAGESARLQLDSNRTAQVTARWADSYNPKKPLQDNDPTDANNGIFIIVADGSPGTTAVNLTIRLKYTIHFFGAIVNPVIVNSSQLFTSLTSPSPTSFLGATFSSVGPGSAVGAGNLINFPLIGQYTITTYATGVSLTATGLSLDTKAVFMSPTYSAVTSGSVAMGTYNINVKEANAMLTITQPASSLSQTYVQINPYSKL